MKTYKYLFLLIGLSIIGCSDLEEEPVGLLAPESFFTSVDDIQTAVNGSYGHMMHRYFVSREMSMPLMLRSDMVDLNPNGQGAERVQFNDVNLLADNASIEQYWPKIYQIIGAANEAIAGAKLVDADDAIKNPIVAQAHFARAFAYFHLVRQFGDVPYLDEPVTDLQAASTVTRTPAEEVYANIIADLEFAEEWLPNTQKARSIPAKSAAQSYLALVYLTRGEFQQAYNYAKEVIDNEGTYNLGLDPDFQNLYNENEDASLEPIFVIDFIGMTASDDSDQGMNYQGPYTGIRNDDQYGLGGGWSVEIPSMAVYDTWDDRDYRKEVSFDDTAVFDGVEVSYEHFTDVSVGGYANGVDRPHIAKYNRRNGNLYAGGNGRGSEQNYMMMRYAEVLLIAAEALNEVSPGSAEAHGYVNRIRERARNGGVANNFTSSTFPEDVSGLSQDDFRTMVLEERRIELAFEFKRWYDIARRKLGSEVFSASGLEGEKPTFDANRDYLFPIPVNEIVRNPNLTQNPGY
ncbi:RagB/SusD family nutrient uptake outer membrane protein [Aureibaculum marinum]|uniref:RagB/SusD family nutrient uptake outer membrane protein n=1 Tax=Aureibaculum marinum TaxID=2487930 RepID=A0A3N4NAL7_9FLAO|nr:RagB/SusD family nutrient uptake outer membrane protein [Aureibaculum marinum]RPD93382.1 RagB/SusD family nutrient uptake outer membrane protein [Aureibaculum marinum]